MQVLKDLRIDMMGLMSRAFKAEDPCPPHGSLSSDPDYLKIRFMDNGSTVLCDVVFKDLILNPTPGQDAEYHFQALDDSFILQGEITVSGTVSKFEILGDSGGGPQIITNGSVGIGTENDIRFNQVGWSESSFITITELSIVLKQGI